MAEADLPRRGNTRDEIIQAAYGLFLENGFHGTSMRAIAERTGLALGGIYNHFAGKEEIYTTIFLEKHPYQEILTQMTLASGNTLEEMLHDAAKRLNATILDRPDGFLKLMFIELVEFNARHIADLFDQLNPQLNALIARFFAARPEMRPLPGFVVLRAFLGLFFSYFMTEWLFSDRLPAEARQNALEHFVDIYLHGILKSAGSEEAA